MIQKRQENVEKIKACMADSKRRDTARELGVTHHEFPGMLVPADVVYDLDGFLWPLFKKYQYYYKIYGNGDDLVFNIPSDEIDLHKVAVSDLKKIKQGYIDAGWTYCSITMNSSSSSAAISVELKYKPKKPQGAE